MRRIYRYLSPDNEALTCLKRTSVVSSVDLQKVERFKVGILTLFVQFGICLLFALFCNYSPEANASEPKNSVAPTFGGFKPEKIDFMFQDVHVMIFVGFGFLMTFLKKYSYSSVGFTLLLGALIVQWALICQGFYELNENYKMELGIKSLYKADIAAAAVLISMGAVLGRSSYMQLIIMGIIEIAVFAANSYLGFKVFQVADAGGSIFVHTFGAYFGLAVSYVIDLKKSKSDTSNSLEEARYTSDIFAMIGTVFLWLFWPSFNAVELTGDDQHRAVINTYLSLASCCVTAFALSLLLTENHKFDMVHIQNSTLAGGVAVGASANLMIEPFGAVLTGILAGILSVYGYAKLTPWLRQHFGLRDTCGINNLHGMPGILAGVIGALMAGIASENAYYKTLYDIYPARAELNTTATAEYNFLRPGIGRTAGQQAGYQILALVVTLAVAVVSGLVTGSILRFSKISSLSLENHYDDSIYWHVPEHSAPPKKFSSQCHFDNPSFEPPVISGSPTDVFS